MAVELREYALRELQTFWSQIVAQFGWQNDNPIIISSDDDETSQILGRHKKIIAEDEELGLRYIDIWWEGDDNAFFSLTMIQRMIDDFTLWQMNYCGWMAKEAEPIVKDAIRQAIKADMFCGGRGPLGDMYSEDDLLLYSNLGLSNFEKFNGTETVYRRKTRIGTIWYPISWLHYSGSILRGKQAA